ncbi:RHS repeat-associated core domain-containing protein [Massilia sp. W12]|uniref:RHS repeat-associated core domain-containing protein n=1 Tax=Massilia sp. W12 TaxID=3126507 RepID=UPI0030CF87D1
MVCNTPGARCPAAAAATAATWTPPRELSDAQGRLRWQASYQSWGNLLQVAYSEVSAPCWLPQLQPLRFQGQYYDAETGLHYNRFRYYDPDIGRFISQDPIGLAGGNNIYQYAANPISWIDPLGLCCNATFTSQQLDKKFKHAPDFGINTTKKNPATLAEYQAALENHLKDPLTYQHGTYSYAPGSNVYFNPATNNVVILDGSNAFLSGWKLQPGTPQFTNYIQNGLLR